MMDCGEFFLKNEKWRMTMGSQVEEPTLYRFGPVRFLSIAV